MILTPDFLHIWVSQYCWPSNPSTSLALVGRDACQTGIIYVSNVGLFVVYLIDILQINLDIKGQLNVIIWQCWVLCMGINAQTTDCSNIPSLLAVYPEIVEYRLIRFYNSMKNNAQQKYFCIVQGKYNFAIRLWWVFQSEGHIGCRTGLHYLDRVKRIWYL